jgi:hypothetical protein
MRWTLSCRDMTAVTMLVTVLLRVVASAAAGQGSEQNEEKGAMEEDAEVKISPMCAASLLVTGTTISAAAAYGAIALTPALLCHGGFCSAGVTKASWAARWQSTMPHVAQRSLFSILQSAAATGGTGALTGMGTTVTVSAGAVGGPMILFFLRDFCGYVDEAYEKSPDSVLGKIVQSNFAVVQRTQQLKQTAYDSCAASPTCMSASEAVSQTEKVASSALSSVWNTLGGMVDAGYARIEIARLESEISEEKRRFGVEMFEHMRANSNSDCVIFGKYNAKVGELEVKLQQKRTESGL